jgi:hypothetical protein
MVQRCKRFTSHFFTVILSVVLLAGFGGEAYGSSYDDHEEKGHDRSEISRDIEKSREIRLQGNVKNINARKTKFELCSTTECTEVDVTRKTSFMDVNGKASDFANLVEDDFATVIGRARDKHHDKGKRHHDKGKRHHDKGKRHHDRDFSPQATIKADMVEIGMKVRYLIINGLVSSLSSVDWSFKVMEVDAATRTFTYTCTTVPDNAEILLVTGANTTTPILFTDLLSGQTVEVHGHYNDTNCFVAQTVLATPL